MKKLNLFSGIRCIFQAQQKEELFFEKNRFFIRMDRVNKRRFFYYAICLITMFAIVQSACKKKETQVVPVVTISGLSKTTVQIGDTLIISGGNFNTTAGKNLVSVATVAYAVIKASATQLVVIVPKGAQSGMLSIGFDQGQSTTFNQLITVAGGIQPFIKSIMPAAAYEGDTVAIKGGNFATLYNYNAITFNGTAARIINVSDSVMKVIIPNSAQTGPVLITSNGFVSGPAQYSISKVDPNADGHINWMYLNYGSNAMPSEAVFNKGLTNTAVPQTAMVYDFKGALVTAVNSSYYPLNLNNRNNQFLDNLVVNDKQNNAYYLTVSTTTYPATYNLMLLNTAGNTANPAAVWNLNIPAPVTTTPYKATATSTAVNINYTPIPQMSMDGNTIYIKMGITDDYYIGDVTASPVALTLQHNVFGDPLAFKPQFTNNYIFYEKMGGSTATGTNPDYITQIRYMPRGSTVSSVVPLPFSLPTNPNNERIVYAQADLTHGNNIIIITNAVNIYKFNADTKQLTTLYTIANWSAGTGVGLAGGNNGFIWLGAHIYYANNTQSLQFNTLYRLNDDGSSRNIYTVYGQLEQNGQAQAQKFYFFLGK
jgi:ribosomal protein L21